MKFHTLALMASFAVLGGCAYLPLGDAQRVQSEAPQGRDAQLAARQDRARVSYKTQPGQVDPKIQPYSVMGKTYWPVQSALGFRQEGFASWYGIDFHGKKTATGEIYDMFSISAAHKTLPLGTKVRVTNLDNGRELELTINDRGPFVDGRVIDLSYASARLLGMADNGLAHVRVVGIADNPVLAQLNGNKPATMVASAEPAQKTKSAAEHKIIERNIVEEPSSSRAKPLVTAEARPVRHEAKAQQAEAPRKAAAKIEAQVAANEPTGRYSVQVGAFSQDENARKVQARLVQQGFRIVKITRAVRGGKELSVVQAGSFDAREKAEEALSRIREEFPSSFISSGA